MTAPSSPSPPPPPSPAPSPRPAVTQLLSRAREGDARATDELFPIVYEELRSIAARYLHAESNAHTLQATALVHEAYLRLLGPDDTPWENRAHFFGAAATAIRRILTDHARHKNRVKRGGGHRPVSLDEALVIQQDADEQLVDIDQALARLAELDPQKAKVVELRFYAGLTVDQTAKALGVSESTVARDWQFARVWLGTEIARQHR